MKLRMDFVGFLTLDFFHASSLTELPRFQVRTFFADQCNGVPPLFPFLSEDLLGALSDTD